MIYRDDSSAVSALRREIAHLTRHPEVRAASEIRQELRRARRRVERKARALARLEKGGLALAPPSFVEVIVACALAFGSLTVGIGLVLLALMVVR